MKILTGLFVLFILLVIFLADPGRLPQPLHAVYDFPNGDKLGHFVLFGLLDFFLTLTFIRSLPEETAKLITLSIGLILALVIGLEEFSQKLFAARTFDLIDLLAGYLGLIAGAFVALKLKTRQSPLQR
jgi:polysaccharide biosynthesis protein VpsQ